MAEGRKLRGVLYGRKSNDDDGASVAQQLEWGRGAAQREDITIVREFVDQSRPGWDVRADFEAMLAFCQAEAQRGEPIDVILCWAPDRFSRADSLETAYYLHQFRQAGADRLYSHTKDWLDLEKPEHRALFTMQQDFGAHDFVLNLSKGSLRGRLAAAKEGRWINGRAPYGYRAVPRPGGGMRLVLGTEDVVERVRWIFRRFLEPSGSLSALANELNGQKIPTPRGKGIWYTQTVRMILTSPTYLGRLRWNRSHQGRFAAVVGFQVQVRGRDNRQADGVQWTPRSEWVEVDGTHEPLIDLDTFQQVQEKIAQMKRGHGTPRASYPLSRLLVCGHCGKNMTGVTLRRPKAGGGELAYPRYCCPNHGVGGCDWNSLAAPDVLKAVVKRLQETVYKEENLRKAIGAIRRQDAEAQEDQPGQMVRLRHRLQTLAGQIEKAEARFASEEDENLWPALRKRVQELRALYTETATELGALELQERQQTVDLEDLAEEAIAAGLRLTDAVEAGDVDLVREIICLAVERIELFFTHDRTGPRVKSRFARGLIHIRAGFPFTSKRKYDFSYSHFSDKTIVLLPDDLHPRADAG